MDLSRQIALDILIAWDRDGSFPNILLRDKLSTLSDVRQRAFCTNLVYGTIENKRRLDYFIAQTSSTPFKKIHIVNRNILRLGLQQILYMNVPSSAACNTSVALAKKNGQFRSSGFVNAILRKLASVADDLLLPLGDDDDLLGIRYSVDTSVVSLLREQCGIRFVKEYFEGLDALVADTTTLAVNTIKTDASALCRALESQGVEVLEQTEQLLTVRYSLNISTIDAYRKGLFHVLGRPSFETANALDVAPNMTVLDLCAAPGGKTFAMAYKMKNQGKIVAMDVHPTKVDNMQKEAERLGITNIQFVCSDAAVIKDNWLGSADRVLCDVPCSGLGIMRKKPDIRYKDMKNFSLYQTQKKILENGLKYLKPNGKLVYSTCTVNPVENHDIAAACAAQIIKEKTYLPQTDGTEGFYLALLSATEHK